MMARSGLYSVALRGLTLASKFLLTIFMARYMTPEDLGVFGLFSTIIYISLLLLSLDFYVFNARELLRVDEAGRPRLIRDQLVLFALVYVLALPALLGIFALDLLPWELVGWFYLILLLEHLSQEGYRLLITLSRPVAANVALFLRQGAWIYAAVALAFFVDDWRDLTIVWIGWAIGSALGIVLIVRYLLDLPWKGLASVPVNWIWLWSGLRNALIFLLASSSLLLVTYLDRFFLQAYFDEGTVGVYVFFNQIANVVQTFVNTGIIMILYPRILSAFQAGDYSGYRTLMRRMARGSIAAAVILACGCAVAVVPLLAWLDRPAFGDAMPVIWIMLVTACVSIASLGPYYALYVRRRDRLILAAHGAALAVAVGANYLLVPTYGIYGAAAATLFAFLLLALLQAAMVVVVDARRQMDAPTGLA